MAVYVILRGAVPPVLRRVTIALQVTMSVALISVLEWMIAVAPAALPQVMHGYSLLGRRRNCSRRRGLDQYRGNGMAIANRLTPRAVVDDVT